MNTPITYYRGKQKMLQHILPLIPDHIVYTKIFLGDGAVFWSKQPSKIETINDKDGFVTNFYEVLKLHFEELYKLIDASIISRDQHIRARNIWHDPGQASKIEYAWSFWYLTNWSFASKIGGGLKYSNEYYSSVPNQMQRKKREFTKRLQKRIENAIVENRDAIEILQSRNVANAFHYIDPPYINADQGHYKGYEEVEFNLLIEILETCRGKFLLSHYSNENLEEAIIRNGWNVARIDKPLMANRNQKKNPERRTEMLVYNYEPKSQIQKIF